MQTGRSSNEYKTRGSDDVMTFDSIKAECLENGTLWEDPDFPAEDSSIYFENPPSVRGDIEWKRPSVRVLTSLKQYEFFPGRTLACCNETVELSQFPHKPT